MKTIDLGRLNTSSAKKITSVISKKLKENEKKASSKIDLGKLAEKLAERKEKATVEKAGEGKEE
jgi:uncharacterized protein YoxC